MCAASQKVLKTQSNHAVRRTREEGDGHSAMGRHCTSCFRFRGALSQCLGSRPCKGGGTSEHSL